MRLIPSIAKNTLFQVIARVVSSGTSFLIAILVARTYGVTGYGDLAKITAFVSLFYLLVDFGFNAVYLQLEKQEKAFRSMLYLRLLVSVVLIGVVGVVTLALPYSFVTKVGYSPFVKQGILLFSLTFITEGLLYSSLAIFQQKLAYSYQVFSSLVGSFAMLLVVGISLYLSLPLLWIVVAYLIGGILESSVALFSTKEPLFPLTLDLSFLKKLTLQTLPLTLMLLLNVVYFRVDMFLLTLFKTTHDVAIYDFAYKFFDFLIALPLFLSNSLYPHLLISEKNSRIPMAKALFYAGVFTCIGFFVVIPVWFATPLLSFIKQEFFASSFALRLLLLSLPIFFATSILQWVFIAKKQQVFLLVLYAVSLVGNVFLNLVFISHYSYVASAIITGISELFVLLCLTGYLLIKRNL